MNERFVLTQLPLSGLILIRRKRMGDTRGYLERLFCVRELAEAGWTDPIAQINLTYTGRQGTIRGMHFQHPPHAEKKLVMCMKGRVYDVAVDIRKNSPTFLEWHGEILSPEASNALMIPEGFAHGFQSLTPDVEMLYCHSAFYAPEYESGICPTDPAINIHWPLEITEMSGRDAAHPLIDGMF
ncbi:MAG: dTDP-4-dehydrorhamnose 3,5-epimerase family protein [Desulfosalsimonadaceae bacterium]|nr:dTDP-4-dehydrorhamnose 3,5-epimerase family protein [Desulfosalsimonadaceae bacterium]